MAIIQALAVDLAEFLLSIPSISIVASAASISIFSTIAVGVSDAIRPSAFVDVVSSHPFVAFFTRTLFYFLNLAAIKLAD